MGPPAITRRAETEADAAFLLTLFRESRAPLEQLPGLDPPLRDQLRRQQFAGQAMTYRALFPTARFDIVSHAGTPIGRIVVDTAEDATTLVDIALLPAWRGRGIGTALIREILSDADRPVRLAVRHGNSDAARLYTALGFVAVEIDAVEVKMRWAADGAIRPMRPVPDRLRLPLSFDPAPLAAEVAALASHDWIAHFVSQNYDGDWSVIPLRGKAGATHPVMMIYADPACRDFEDTPFLAACPAIRAVLAAFACPLEAVRLMRLGPGAIIKEHVDHDLDVAQGAVRFHVPITSSPDVVFTLNGTRVVMEPGSAWYLRLADPHAVENRGATDRVHLVIDARVDPSVERLLAAATAA